MTGTVPEPEYADVVVVGARCLGTALVKALVTTGADRRDVLREVAAELPIEVGIRVETLRDKFRYDGWAPSERPGWDVGPEPAARARTTPPTTPPTTSPTTAAGSSSDPVPETA